MRDLHRKSDRNFVINAPVISKKSVALILVAATYRFTTFLKRSIDGTWLPVVGTGSSLAYVGGDESRQISAGARKDGSDVFVVTLYPRRRLWCLPLNH